MTGTRGKNRIRRIQREKERLKERITKESEEEEKDREGFSTLCCTTWPTKRPPETFIKATASSETHTTTAAAAAAESVCLCVCVKPAARCSLRSVALRRATD